MIRRGLYKLWQRQAKAMRNAKYGENYVVETPLVDLKDLTADQIKVTSDGVFGGKSKGEAGYDATLPGIRFSGEVDTSTEGTEMDKSGFVGVTIGDQGYPWDVEDYSGFKLKVRTDGRMYVMNVRRDDMYYSEDVWQSVLQTPPGEWQEVVIPFNSFVLTWRGKVDTSIRKQDFSFLKSFGFLMADRQNGPFSLEIQSITLLPQHPMK